MSSTGRVTPLANGLTPKQNAFKNKVIEQIQTGKNPNGTQAALAVYDTNDAKSAHSIATDNFRNPAIKKSIEDALKDAGSSREKLIKNLTKISNLPVQKASAETIANVNLNLLKLIEPREREASGGNTYIFNNMSFSEAKKELESMSTKAEDFIIEAE